MLRLLKSKNELEQFTRDFRRASGCRIPASYLEGHWTKVWAVPDGTGYCAGFAIIYRVIKRTIQQMPVELHWDKHINHIPAELTCYFINRKTPGFRFTLGMVMKTWRHPAKYFIYSYATTNKHLEKMYGLGKPERVYSGKVYNLDTNPRRFSSIKENIEILSWWGILRIFLSRTKSETKQWLSKKLGFYG